MFTAMPDDDSAFVAAVRRIAGRLLDRHQPAELFIMRIDNWFDHKWLAFSGKVMGAFGVHADELTVPPFHPNRVQSEAAYARTETGTYTRNETAMKLHLAIRSEDNLKREIAAVSQDALFVWYSGGSGRNARGSLMLYRASGEEAYGWFASFEKRDEWQIAGQRGIGREVLEALAR